MKLNILNRRIVYADNAFHSYTEKFSSLTKQLKPNLYTQRTNDSIACVI